MSLPTTQSIDLSQWRPARRNASRMTIGVLLTSLSDSRIAAVYEGISEVAGELGIDVVCYAVGLVETDNMKASRMSSILSDLISPDYLDGVITMQFWHRLSRFETFCRNYLQMPISTISRSYPGYCGVSSDTYAGCRSLVRHLIEEHGFTRFVYICAHKENETHRLRYQSFLDECKEQHIEVRPQQIIEFEDWSFSTHPNEDNLNRGREAIRRLLDERGLVPGRDFEAIISAAELVAIGAVHDLQERGYNVPHDVVVVSDENTQEGAVMTPPITTVGVAWKEMGRQGARIMIEQILDAQNIQHVLVPALLVVRHSCGCYSEEVEQAGLNRHRAAMDAENSVIPERAAIIRALEESAHHLNGTTASWAEDIVDAFMDDITHADTLNTRDSRFLQKLESLLISWGKTHGHLVSAHSVFSQLHHYAFALFTRNNENLRRAETLLQQGQIIISQLAEQVQVSRRAEQDRLITIIQEIGQRLISSFEINGLMAILNEELPHLGIRRSYLSLYEDPTNPTGNARLVLAFDERGTHTLPENGIVFPAQMLVPPDTFPPEGLRNMVVEPLYFGDDQIGFALFETSALDTKVYNLLRSEISSALQGTILMQRINQRTREVEDTNRALQESITSLKLYQNQLIRSEKMAALGQLVAGVAHEINTPIGVGVTAASFLEQESKNIQQHFENNTLKKSELAHYVDDAIESSRLILSNLSRADELVQSFKRIAVDQTFEEERDFLIYAYLQDVLSSLSPKLRLGQHQVEIDCPEDLQFRCPPGAFYQIFTNLIMNSIHHGFEGIHGGTIRIQVRRAEEHTLHIVYTDNGKGMNEDTLRQMFDPFFTTKRGQGGTGLGMNIVFNLITQKLHGNVDCTSSPGHGVCFDLRLPFNAPAGTPPSGDGGRSP